MNAEPDFSMQGYDPDLYQQWQVETMESRMQMIEDALRECVRRGVGTRSMRVLCSECGIEIGRIMPATRRG